RERDPEVERELGAGVPDHHHVGVDPGFPARWAAEVDFLAGVRSLFHQPFSALGVCSFRALAVRGCLPAPPLTCGVTSQTVVEVAGVEPASSELSTGLLRAQPARESRVVTDHRPSMTTPAR